MSPAARAWRPLHRPLVTAEHASLHQAAQALGLWQSILYGQIARLEHACGGTRIHHSPVPPGAGTLTRSEGRYGAGVWCSRGRSHFTSASAERLEDLGFRASGGQTAVSGTG